jgi:hypothetical protein
MMLRPLLAAVLLLALRPPVLAEDTYVVICQTKPPTAGITATLTSPGGVVKTASGRVQMPKHSNDKKIPTQRAEQVAAKEQAKQIDLDALRSVADLRAAMGIVLEALGLREAIEPVKE